MYLFNIECQHNYSLRLTIGSLYVLPCLASRFQHHNWMSANISVLCKYSMVQKTNLLIAGVGLKQLHRNNYLSIYWVGKNSFLIKEYDISLISVTTVYYIMSASSLFTFLFHLLTKRAMCSLTRR